MIDVDAFDLRMLAALQADGRLTNQQLADAVGLSASQCSRRRTRLEDDGIIAGYHARLSPRRLAGTLGPARAERLATAIRDVLLDAIDAGGSSLRDYVQSNGELGNFQRQFRVYDRAGQPCPACGRPIVRLVQGGRATFLCAGCQR